MEKFYDYIIVCIADWSNTNILQVIDYFLLCLKCQHNQVCVDLL